MLTRKTPLKPGKPLKATTIKASGRRLKSSKPKMTPARKAAEGEDCTLMFAGCTNQNVVLCHLRMFKGGGEGLKPHDSEAVFGCDWCHNVLDGRQKPAPAWTMGDVAWALIKTLRRQREKGVLIFKGEGE